MKKSILLLIVDDDQEVHRVLTTLKSLKIKHEIVVIPNTKQEREKLQEIIIPDDYLLAKIHTSFIVSLQEQLFRQEVPRLIEESNYFINNRQIHLAFSGKSQNYFKKEKHYKKSFSRIRRSI